MPRLIVFAAVTFAALLGAASAPTSAAAQLVPRPRLEPSPSTDTRSQAVAHLLAVIPGAGHVYAGEPRRGLAFLGGMAGVFAVGALVTAADCMSEVWAAGGDSDCGETPASITGLAVTGLWAWSIYDAGMAARRTNSRLQPRVGSPSLILSPTRTAASPTRDVTAVKLGISLTTR